MDKLREVDVNKGRNRLDGLSPLTKPATEETVALGFTVQDAMKLLRAAQIEVTDCSTFNASPAEIPGKLALGLQILQEKHCIHRDLTPESMADTFCGSPLYKLTAPEIIRNKKYDAKADLWSAGAIQLVTGKPPFDGTNQFQLFHNIVRDTELKFPEDSLNEIHPDCVDLCKSLLRRDPIERLTFREFFSHRFLQKARQTLGVMHYDSTGSPLCLLFNHRVVLTDSKQVQRMSTNKGTPLLPQLLLTL